MKFIILDANGTLAGRFSALQPALRTAADLAELNRRAYFVWECVASYDAPDGNILDGTDIERESDAREER